MTRNVTHVSMIMTDGQTSVYGVYRSVVRLWHRPPSERYILLSHSDRIATVEHNGRAADFDYLGTARRYETPEYPAFHWGHGDNLK